MVLACLAACHKDKEIDVKEAVVSNEEMTVSGTQVCFSWQVDFAGQFQTGVEVSQNENMADLRRVEASKEEDKFVAVVDSLTEGKKYYYRIVVWNKFGSYEEIVKDFTTAKTFSIHVEASEGGTATGGGTFAEGDTCTVVATANVGYNFVNWTENGSQVSAMAEYSFAVTNNRNFVANFTSQEFTITATAEPEEGGTVSGSGGYNYGDECSLTATANDEYKFDNWTENGEIVSEEARYSFTVTADRDLVANFSILPPNTCYIAASPEPDNGGTVLGGGTYNEGNQCTLTANANTDDGYQFDYWTRNGITINELYTFTFTVTESATYVAHFKLKQYWIDTSVEPTGSGTVSGGNHYYNHGATCNLTASANNNAQYEFDHWTKNGASYPGGASISFTVTEAATYKAYFRLRQYTISVSASPSNGGNVIGGGAYDYGTNVNLSANANANYTFDHWQDGNTTNPRSITVTGNATYTAYFITKPTVTTNEVTNIQQTTATCGGNVTNSGGATVTARGVCWSTSLNPTITSSHTTDGTGTGTFTSTLTGLMPGTTYYVRAYATNSVDTGYGGQKSFTTLPAVPQGAINGLFSVSATQQVWFSQGNLQYQASTNTWRFAENQWDYVGSGNNNASPTYSGWIDVFAWGTSGYNHGAVCYQPWSMSGNYSDYYAYGNSIYNLYNQDGRADWGYNPISNGGNTINMWRTLPEMQWNYLLRNRNTPSGIRYAKAKVNNVDGVILLPDNWNASIFSLNNTNQGEVSFSSNIITSDQWTGLQNAGAVFLPMGGWRWFIDNNHGWQNNNTYYWSSEAFSENLGDALRIQPDRIEPTEILGREEGACVRLVHYVQ